jgi:hypothetical protein
MSKYAKGTRMLAIITRLRRNVSLLELLVPLPDHPLKESSTASKSVGTHENIRAMKLV